MNEQSLAEVKGLPELHAGELVLPQWNLDLSHPALQYGRLQSSVAQQLQMDSGSLLSVCCL